MSTEQVLVLLIVGGLLVALTTTRIAADAVLLGALTLVAALPVPAADGWRFGLLPAADLLAGFSNPGMLAVGALFIVVAGLRETGAIDWIGAWLLGRPSGDRAAIARMMAPTLGMSAFLNNTPVVAMMIPAVSDWARKLGVAPSRLMIPLSYAAILGGTCTLIGTSTNLVVAGLVLSHTDLKPLTMFGVSTVGVPLALVGAAFVTWAGPLLLPDRRSSTQALSDPREYTMELLVPERSPLVGRSVEEAGLRNLPGCFLVEITRGADILTAVGPERVLQGGDRLLFAGVVEAIRTLANTRGLAPATEQIFKLDSPRHRRRLFEAVVAAKSPVVGKTVREGRFRNRYDGAIIAVARNGVRLRGKLGDLRLRAGDVLLVEADPSFMEHGGRSRDFLLVRRLSNSAPRRHDRAPLAIAILALMVLLATVEVYPMVVAALLAAAAMVVTGCCTLSEARRSVDWPVLIVIGAALGIGTAVERTGTAELLAHAALDPVGPSPWLALAVFYAVTSLLTEVLTNNAAVALLFPIAQATAASLGVSFEPFVIALMMAGSASFATPLGYQTNLMVYGPGGYTYGDFLRIGIPMNIVAGVVTVALVPLLFPF